MKIKRILIDMDGVLLDFVKGSCEAHGRSNPYLNTSTLYPASLGIFDLASLWDITPREFWAPMAHLGMKFWDSLEKLPEADRIIELAEKTVGSENVAILTAPSSDPGCIPGKLSSIKRHYPHLIKRTIFTGAKQFLANPDSVLIDDKESNIDTFFNAGGNGILLPRLWNSAYEEADKPLERLSDLLDIMN